MREKIEICPNCLKEDIREELLFIPAKEHKGPILYCTQCEREYPCDDNGRMVKPKNIVCC